MLVCFKRYSYSVCSTPSYASKADCKEPNVEKELEKPHLSDLVVECKEILTSVGKLLAIYVARVDPEPLVFVEPTLFMSQIQKLINQSKKWKSQS